MNAKYLHYTFIFIFFRIPNVWISGYAVGKSPFFEPERTISRLAPKTTYLLENNYVRRSRTATQDKTKTKKSRRRREKSRRRVRTNEDRQVEADLRTLTA